MRRTLATLVAVTSLALGGAVVVAGPAAADSDRAAVKACPGTDHQGRHRGWPDSPGTERRNVGGTCVNPG